MPRCAIDFFEPRVVELSSGAGHELHHFLLVRVKILVGVLAGEEGLLEVNRLVEDLGGGGVAQGSVFPRRRMIDEAAVEHPAERAAPAEIAFVVGAHFRAAHGGCPGRPVSMVIGGMSSASGEGTVARHHGEVLGAILVAEKFHREGDAGVLTVAIVSGCGAKVAIGNGTLIDVGAEEFVGALDG